MLNINDIIKDRFQNQIVDIKKLQKSERAEITKELYEIYTSQSERIHRKKENWKRYIKYLKSIKSQNTVEQQNIFKKKKEFIKEMNIENFCFMIGHIKTKDFHGNQDAKIGDFSENWYIRPKKAMLMKTYETLSSYKKACTNCLKYHKPDITNIYYGVTKDIDGVEYIEKI